MIPSNYARVTLKSKGFYPGFVALEVRRNERKNAQSAGVYDTKLKVRPKVWRRQKLGHLSCEYFFSAERSLFIC